VNNPEKPLKTREEIGEKVKAARMASFTDVGEQV